MPRGISPCMWNKRSKSISGRTRTKPLCTRTGHLAKQRKKRFNDGWVPEQGQHASEVAGGIKKVRILGRRMAGSREPFLEERSTGGEDKEGEPNRHQQQQEQPNDRALFRRRHPVFGHAE